MEAIQIFQKYIGERLTPIVLQYQPYQDTFLTYPYHHSTKSTFESEFVEIMFDSIVFYAYEKDEIEKEYNRGRFSKLRAATRNAYEQRIPKTEREADGLLGELALDSFIKCFFDHIQMLYSRAKYLERYPRQEIDIKRAGHEIKGYDSMLFSIENGQKYMWVGQVKTGTWTYCLNEIKKDISKSIIKNYFSSAMIIMADIMRATSSVSDELQQIIDDLNDYCLEYPTDKATLYEKVHDYFVSNNITVRIPCLIIADENEYADEGMLLNHIKAMCHEALKGFSVASDGPNVEVLLLVFPVRNLKEIRKEFLALRKLP